MAAVVAIKATRCSNGHDPSCIYVGLPREGCAVSCHPLSRMLTWTPQSACRLWRVHLWS